MAAQYGDVGPSVPPLLILSLGVVAISFGAIFVRLAEAPSLVTAAYRVGLASVLLAPVACFRSRSELAGLGRRDVGLAMLAGFFLALHFATWIASLDYTSVANSEALLCQQRSQKTDPNGIGVDEHHRIGHRGVIQ